MMGMGKDKSAENFLKRYNFITLEELKEREQKYAQRIMELRLRLNLIIEAEKQKDKIDIKEMSWKKWQEYLSGVYTPPPNKPASIRTFVYQQQENNLRSMANDFDRTLSVDELSILTQNLNRIDKTRRTLMQINKPNFGIEYVTYIANYLKILHNMNNYLNNDAKIANINSRILKDIIDVKNFLQQEIQHLLNCYTYRILRFSNIYMNSIDVISAENSFTCDDFQIHVWTLKRVPIRFTHMAEPRFLINFHNLNMILHVPFSVLKEELSFQAIHVNFDLLTEHAKSFQQIIHMPVAEFNAGIKELPDCLYQEWDMQMDMQAQIRENMKVVQVNNQKKETHIEKSRQKRKSTHKSVTQIIDDKYPDVYEEFLQEEDKLYKNFMNIVYSPASLGLSNHAVNLKEFLILGGIYQIFNVQKPSTVDFNNFSMTWQSPNEEILIRNDLCISAADLSDTNIQEHFKTKKLNFEYINFEANNDFVKHEIESDCPWFVISIILPEYLCLWGTPVPCQYEEFEEVIPEISNEETIDRPLSHLFHSFRQTKSIIGGDVDLKDQDELGAYLMKAHRKSQRQSAANFFQPSLYALRMSGMPKYDKFILEQTGGVFHIQDFPLKGSLNCQQEDYLKRYCLPQIVSSYKFERTIQEEELEQLSEQPRSKIFVSGNNKKPQDEILKRSNATFSYDMNQNNPERLFPIFPKITPTVITNPLSSYKDTLPFKPSTFYQLVKTLTLIKRLFQFNVRHILDLPHFKSKVDFNVHGSRIREARKKNIYQITMAKDTTENLQKTRRQSRTKIATRTSRGSRSSLKPYEVRNHAFSGKWRQSITEGKKRSSTIKLRQSIIENRNTVPTTNPKQSLNEEEIPASSTKSRQSMTGGRKRASTIKLRQSISENRNIVPITKSKQSLSEGQIPVSSDGERLESSWRSKQSISEGRSLGSSTKSDQSKFNQFSTSTSVDKNENAIKQFTKCSHWTTEHIKSSSFNRSECKVIIETDRLGYLAFAFKRYEHFPFKNWTLQPNELNPQNVVTLILDTQYVRCIINVTADGITGYVTEQYKEYVYKPKKYLVIDEPLTEFEEFKSLLQRNNINIFAEHEAQFYIDKNRYYCEKHLATELHTYCCMVLHCTQMKFSHNQWNRLANRRDIVLDFQKFNTNVNDNITVRLTPEEAFFVRVAEPCSLDLNNIKIQFLPTWRNIGNYADLYQLVCSAYPEANELRCQDAKLICTLKSLLFGIRPLSFA